MGLFSYYNVRFRKEVHTDGLVASGEVKNESNRDYANVVFRIRLLVGSEMMGESLFNVVDFHRGVVRNFEKSIEGVSFQITHKSFTYEIFFEGGY